MNKMNNEPVPGAGYNGAAPQGLAELFGVTAAMQMLRRRFLIMLLVGLTVAAAAFTFLMLRTPTYTATSLLIITPAPNACWILRPSSAHCRCNRRPSILKLNCCVRPR